MIVPDVHRSIRNRYWKKQSLHHHYVLVFFDAIGKRLERSHLR